MLAWWALFPALLYVAVQLKFGWADAKVSASSPDYAVSYLGGAIVGGMLLALVIGYVVYMIGSRSQLAGSLTFAIILVLQSGNVYVQSRGRAPQRHHFAGFGFEAPRAWQSVSPGNPTTVAELVLPAGRSRAKPKGLIVVDVGTPKSDLRQIAASFVAQAGGQVLPDPAPVDGVDGIRVETASTDLSRPKLVIALMRGPRMYLIMAAAADGYDVRPDFDRVVQTWKWDAADAGGGAPPK
jgi:hypothetical protein